MGIDDDIIEFRVRPAGTSCHLYLGCDYQCRILFTETVDGWVPQVTPESFEPGAWDAPVRTSREDSAVEERLKNLADIFDWADDVGGGDRGEE